MKNVIPVFFATDDNYAPFVTVTLESILANSSDRNEYRFYVLTTKELSPENKSKILSYSRKNFTVEIVSLSKAVEATKAKFHLRDYYSLETYLRFFIPDMFPQYDKILYMDCDIICLGDISQLYNHDISDYMVGAVQEEVMSENKVFGDYVEMALDVKCENYFNAGILLMNAKKFREENVIQKFLHLLNRYTFRVTQDQDYLNVICNGHVKLFDLGWNKTSFKNPKFNDKNLKIIHYKMMWKPWLYKGIIYEEYFWEYAKKTPFYTQILSRRDNYPEESKQKDRNAYENLLKMAATDAKDPANYKNSNCTRIAV